MTKDYKKYVEVNKDTSCEDAIETIFFRFYRKEIS